MLAPPTRELVTLEPEIEPSVLGGTIVSWLKLAGRFETAGLDNGIPMLSKF
jgi:hypothetical protein